MGKKLTVEEVEKRIFEKHGETIRLVVETYKNTVAYYIEIYSKLIFGEKTL